MNYFTARLPRAFTPKKNDYLCRVGSQYDGGYVVSKSDIKKSDSLLSFGINDDWSFEKTFLDYNNVNTYCFDGSLTTIFWIKYTINAFIKFKFHKLLNFAKFNFFFKSNRFFVKKYVSDLCNKNHVTLSEIINRYCKNCNKIFLKVDIEGSEYRILDDILLNSKKFSSVVIEFHDFDLNLDKIENFVKFFSLKIIHIHINNYSALNKKLIPSTTEITFSNDYQNTFVNKLPNKFDSPNNQYLSDYKINFY